MSTSAPIRRPAGVTVIMVLTYLVGILDLVTGLVLLFGRDDATLQRDSGLSGGTLLTVAIVMILLAVFVILLAGALGRGSGGARMIIAFLMVLRLLLGIWGTIAIHSTTRWSSLVSALVALVVLLLLFSASANAWFASKKY